jgi:hypothetical protein
MRSQPSRTPQLSVIVPTRNRALLLRRTLIGATVHTHTHSPAIGAKPALRDGNDAGASRAERPARSLRTMFGVSVVIGCCWLIRTPGGWPDAVPQRGQGTRGPVPRGLPPRARTVPDIPEMPELRIEVFRAWPTTGRILEAGATGSFPITRRGAPARPTETGINQRHLIATETPNSSTK